MPITQAPVLVTGATGFVGSEVTAQLLAAGYTVRGTTRHPDGKLADVLRSLPGAERLTLYTADLLDPGSFDEAVTGCKYVMHVASPYATRVDDPQKDLVDPAVNGTLNVLSSAANGGTVERVVVTSSFAAIMGRDPSEGAFTEDDWNTKDSLHRSPYNYSKTVAEKAAWDYVKANPSGFDLVIINPPGIIGPSVVPRVNETDGFFIGLTNGTQPAVVHIDWPFVDVRDVALAHIKAIETPQASGRYLTAAGNATVAQIKTYGQEVLGDKFKFPKLHMEGAIGTLIARAMIRFQPEGVRGFMEDVIGRPHIVDNSKVRNELGIQFRDMGETIRETWADLDRLGFLGKKVKSGDIAP